MSVMRPCTWCGKGFTPSRSDGLFHSSACKQAYWRWKHKLNYLRAGIRASMDELEQYLEHENTRKEAENVLGEIADRVHALGFEHDVEQLPLPVDSYTITNQLGE